MTTFRASSSKKLILKVIKFFSVNSTERWKGFLKILIQHNLHFRRVDLFSRQWLISTSHSPDKPSSSSAITRDFWLSNFLFNSAITECNSVICSSYLWITEFSDFSWKIIFFFSIINGFLINTIEMVRNNRRYDCITLRKI